MQFTNPNNVDLTGYHALDFFTAQGRYRGTDKHLVGIADLDSHQYVYRWEDDLDDQAADAAKAEAKSAAPETDGLGRWSTDTDDEGVFLVLIVE